MSGQGDPSFAFAAFGIALAQGDAEKLFCRHVDKYFAVGVHCYETSSWHYVVVSTTTFEGEVLGGIAFDVLMEFIGPLLLARWSI